MQGRMEIRVLGPLEVVRDGRPIDVRGTKRRAVLAMLVLHANEVVRTDRLIDDLWGEHRPVNAQAALQNHVSRLRRDIGADVLVTKPWGYVLRVDPEAIDLRRFERLLAESRPLAAKERAQKLAEALALWHGAALADLAHEGALAVEIDRLEELRLAASEERVDADLELGGHPELVHELESLVALHPLRERLRGQLILALYRAGRQAEALETYRETRRVLVEELGIEPSPELRDLERAILRHDPSLGVAAPVEGKEVPQPESSRWRWPRSPLAAAAALVLLASAGALAAFVLTANGPASVTAAAPTESSTSSMRPETTTTTREPPAPPKARPKKPAPRPGETTTTTTRPRETVAETTSQPDPPASSRPETTKRVTTTTTTTTTTDAKPKPPPLRAFTIADDFSRPGFDPTIWHIIGRDSGGVFDQSNGQLEITLLADAKPDPAFGQVGGHYGTRCQFTGDFDASVEFELLTWPSGAGAYAGLNAFFADSAVVRQSSAQWGDQYASWVNGANGGILLEDRQGKLRLRRVGATITTYFWHGGGWRSIVSGRSTGRATLGLQLQADGDEFSHTDVRVAFDNFVVEATEADCPPGSDPR